MQALKTIAFFNNKGGVGKTSLVYHVAWMLRELGLSVVAADLDPQANLTSFFLDEEEIEELWERNEANTVWRAIRPLYEGAGGLERIVPQRPDDSIALVSGDLELSRYEDELSRAWAECTDGKARAFRVIGAFAEVIRQAAAQVEAAVALVDLGPNLGSLNRAALTACDHVVLPLGPDLFSIQGLRNVGPTLRTWREQWAQRRSKAPPGVFAPEGPMAPAGYVMMRHAIRLDRPVRAYDRWMAQAPGAYREAVLGEPEEKLPPIEHDPHCLARLKDYRSLMAMAQEARKPMFLLKPADGAIGGHQTAVAECYDDFLDLVRKIAKRCDLSLPS
ncbi:MAG: phage-related regulatory protein [Geminicoccaceae bacterium]|jgi:cellulose biosynthesis protein BcsQ|nr:MAG: phage-related regulatory protein [Geminicoccaceae bacterium]